MTVKIQGTTISMTRGDTLRLKIDILNPDGTTYEPITGDSIRFAMKTKYNDSEPLIMKNIPIDTLNLVLNPEDTKDLKQPSDYVYDIQLTHANGDVDTFIANAKLKVTEEVY